MTLPALVWTDAGLTFGVDRQLVQAVVRTPDFSRMPLGPVWLVGVINRFGRAVAVVDVGLLGGLKAGPCVARQVIIVEGGWGELGIALAEAPVEGPFSPKAGGGLLFDGVSFPPGLHLVSPEGVARTVSGLLGVPHA